MKGRVYQNDFIELEGVADTGCLFMSLLDIVAQALHHTLTHEKVCAIYHLCNERGIIGTWKDKKADGAYVWDHTSVLNMASIVLGRKDVSWEYSARVYTEQQKKRGKTSYIPNPDYITEAQYMIFQIKTTAVNGHFRRMDYDPWQAGSTEVYLKSVRYYRMVV